MIATKQFRGLLILFLGLLMISACKKSDSTSSSNNNNNNNTPPAAKYYFTFKAGGVAKDFKAINALKDDPLNFQALYIAASPSTTVQVPIFNFFLQKIGLWNTGLTYKLSEIDKTSHCEYTSEGGFVYKTTASLNSPTTGLTITFTEFNLAKDSAIAGTFSGNLQLEENTNTIDITEGKFRIPFLN